MSTTSKRLTVDDLDSLPNDGRRYEIVTGEFFMSPAPDRVHQSVVVALTLLLGNHIARDASMRLFVAPVDVRFSSIDQVQPDLLLIHRERMSIYQGSTVFGAPDLVIEVISPSSRTYDEVVKLNLYEQNGVSEYWILDPLKRTFRILALENGRYQPQPENQDEISSKVLPELTIDQRRFFANLDD